jgi:hypothetical protein
MQGEDERHDEKDDYGKGTFGEGHSLSSRRRS